MDNVIVEENTDGERKAHVDNVIVEESTDGEQKAEVGEEEALNETRGNTIFGESTAECTKQVGEEEASKEIVGNANESIGAEQTAHVGEEEAPKETMCHSVVEESSDVEHTAQVGEEEALKETMGYAIFGKSANRAQVGEEVMEETACNVMVVEHKDMHKAHVREEVLNKMVGNDIIEESTDGEHKTQVGKKEMLSETVGSVSFAESTDGENKAEAGKEEVPNETMGSLFAEGSTDGEHNTQVRGEEASNETTSNLIVKESTAVEHLAHVEEDEVLIGTAAIFDQSTDGKHKSAMHETMDDVIVEESTYGELKGEVREDEAFNATMNISEEEEVLNKTVGNIIVEESTNGEHKAEIRKAAVLDKAMCDVSVEENTDGDLKGEVSEAATVNEKIDIIEEGTDGKHMAQVGEEEANERMDNLMVEKNTDGEHKAQVAEEEALNETEKQAMQYMAPGTRTMPLTENDQYVSYNLPSLDKADFSVSDLVWGKVKSHPWWPGQIFDPSDATKLAMKYQKKDSFLIGYFGDKTFAWCEESQLKHFHSYFSQMEKQCSSDTFVKAIHDILTEVARRVELGMACSCLPEEDYTNVKYQKVENAGIRGGNINSIIDRSTVANYFQPARLLEYIQTLAQIPNGRVDRLEFVIFHSQLKAFYHSKGYPELPVFAVGGGLVENVPENSTSNGKRTLEDIAEHCIPVPSDSIYIKGKPRSDQISLNKQAHRSVDDDKQKNICKLAEARTGSQLENGGKSKFVAKATEKPISSSSGKKHIIVESDIVDLGRCKKRMLDSFEGMKIKSTSPTVTSSFKIGEFIRRAASQLTGGPPIIKYQTDALQKCCPQTEHKKDANADFDVFPDSPIRNQTTNLSFIEDDNSPDEMLSQLCLAARNPMEEFSFVSTIVTFFTAFRNHSVSSSSDDKEHVEKRKRGRTRNIIAQIASSDVGSSEDEKHVEKRKRVMLTNIIYHPASSDVSSADEKLVEKPVERRKRGRPRKNPQPASSDSYEDKKHVQKSQRGRPRGRPKKVDAQLACHDYSSSENKKLVELRKRGRAKKGTTEIAPSDMPASDHMKGSYWSEMDLQQKRNGKGPMQYQRKRRKSTGEKSLSLPANPVQEIEHQLQLIAMNPNLKLTFIEERSIISVEEKIVDECIPTVLILSFNNANSIPSETDLIRIFSRYGPLKEAETDVLRKTNRAKVVFKRRVDAETAFSSAGKYSIFGPGLLSYQLKPWTPRSTLQGTLQGTQDVACPFMPQDTHDVAPIAMPQENSDVVGNNNAAPITTTQDNHDASFSATPLDKHDSGSITTSHDYRDLAPITMVQGNDGGPTERTKLEFPEQSEAVIVSDAMQIESGNVESSPYEKHAPSSIASHEGHQDVVFVTSSSLNVCDLTRGSIHDYMDAAPSTIGQDNHDASGIITLQEKCDVGHSVGSTSELSEQVEDVIASDTKQVEAEGKESSSPNDNGDPVLIAEPQENQAPVPVVSPSTSTQEKLDAAHIIMVLNNHDAVRPIVGSNFELSEQAEDVIASDSIQVEAESKESLPHGRHDPTPIPIHQENQDALHAASALDEQYSVPTTTQDDLDAAPISMEQDGHDATCIITLHGCVEGLTVGSDCQFLDQSEVVTASDSVQAEAVDKESTPRGSHGSAGISTEPVHQDAIHSTSLLDEHDLKAHTSIQDNLDATPIDVDQDYHNADAIIIAQDNCDAEQAADVIALDAVKIEPDVKESLLEDTHDPMPEQNQDAEPIALLLDKHDSTPSTTQESLDAATISMPQDNRSASPLTAPHDKHDEATIATPQHNHDAESMDTLLDTVSTTTPPACYVAAVTTKQANHHKAFVATLQDKHDSAQISTAQDWHGLTLVTAVHDNPNYVAAISLQERCDAVPSIGSNSKPSDQAVDVITSDNIRVVNDYVPKQPEDGIMSDTIQVEADGRKSLPENNDDPATSASEQNQDTQSITSTVDDDDSIHSTTENKLDAASNIMPLDDHDPALITTAQDDHDDVSIATSPNYPAAPIRPPPDNLCLTSIATQDGNHDLVHVTKAEGSPDLEPITMVEDNHNASAIIVLEDKCDTGSAVGSNLEIPEQAEDAIVFDTIQIEGGNNVSLPKAKDDPPTITPPQQIEGVESVATLADKLDSTPITTEENCDVAHVDTSEHNHGAAPITTPQDTIDVTISGEQVESGVALETVQLEAEGCKLEVPELVETETDSGAMLA